MNNRILQRRNERRFAARKNGGGYGMGAPLLDIPSGAETSFDFFVKQPIHQSYDDCAFPARDGQLINSANPALAQTAMAGGGNPNYIAHEWSDNADVSKAQVVMAGGGNPNYIAHEWSDNADVSKAQVVMAGGRRSRTLRRRKSQRAGGCGCSGSKLFGGARRRRRTVRGGAYTSYAIDPSISVGGTGPNVGAAQIGVPCDPRAGTSTTTDGMTDPRAPTDLYSLTANSRHTGGAYSTGNAYGADCYKAPGSMIPVYPADNAGFRFEPSTNAMPDGVTPFNTVVPYAARMGGARRTKRAKGTKRTKHKSIKLRSFKRRANKRDG